MNKTSSDFHFPPDIKLSSSPLAEAWLEIRWQLQPYDQSPNLMKDPNYPFALGVFYENVKKRFGYRKDLSASNAPQDMLPYVVRHQFRPSEDGWPILQLGPGVASVNFTEPYNWNNFRDEAVYLRSALSKSYSKDDLHTKTIILKYRNAHSFAYSTHDLLEFLKNNLNISISLPSQIPGTIGSKHIPTSSNIQFTFDLKEPKGTGTLTITTGSRKQDGSEVLISQLEVASGGDDAPGIGNEKEFVIWLNLAHSAIHEWFFSLVEGPLLDKYQIEGE